MVDFRSLSDDQRWQAVLERDRKLDGVFVYAVRSTGIYCRTGCPSRRPRRDQVRFFPLPAAAEQEGFRACRRCKPREAIARDPHVLLAERTCRLLESSRGSRMTLSALARGLGVSAPHLQRVFTRVTGVSPRAYAEHLRSARLRSSLKSGETVSRALYDAGYGSPSRIYEKRSAGLGMTPATLAKGGAGERISYAVADSALGTVLVAASPRGLCFVTLGDSERAVESALSGEFPRALRVRDDAALAKYVKDVLSRIAGREPHEELAFDVRATAFQRQVWDALRRIPPGTTISYSALAKQIGRPSAVRAVASAVAKNPVAIIVPCHRIVREDGAIGGYRWGVERKTELLRLETRPKAQRP
ncbi:MAG TPA: bifunctional DNA-binding transcriptional regulator/O6-methylguanine-DNA methyltransferase Ada [Gemmatimonadales bacterium]|nr:bifunctional DNA-binding transcriptional regulator/O6-methylguanine-DNA methyltransferase Ada [Gemmatimonadales bacterium]